jgi:hypothetical protein
MVESLKIYDLFESVSYTMGRGPLKVSRDFSLVQIPNCGYEYQLTSDDELGLLFEYDEKELSWIIDLNDNSLEGVYQIGVILANEVQNI